MRQSSMLVAFMLAVVLATGCGSRRAEDPQRRLVRIAELEIDPAQLESYKTLLREEIESSIRVEPGVLTLYAVSIKDHPTQIRIFEMYTDAAAYKSHLQTPHFQKYKTGTKGMVQTLRLIETDPILLGVKARRDR